jgi:hypothetical protein
VLLEIHIFLILLAFATLFVSISLSRGIDEEGRTTRGNIPLIIIAGILFFYLSFTSLDIDYKECENQISWMNTTDNDTSLTNNLVCSDDIIVDTPQSSLFLGLGIVSTVLMLIFLLQEFKGKKGRPELRNL